MINESTSSCYYASNIPRAYLETTTQINMVVLLYNALDMLGKRIECLYIVVSPRMKTTAAVRCKFANGWKKLQLIDVHQFGRSQVYSTDPGKHTMMLVRHDVVASMRYDYCY